MPCVCGTVVADEREDVSAALDGEEGDLVGVCAAKVVHLGGGWTFPRCLGDGSGARGEKVSPQASRYLIGLISLHGAEGGIFE